eukprot:30505-Prorocentrum_lima.AAC.1
MVVLPRIQQGHEGVQKLQVMVEHTQVLVTDHLEMDLEDTSIPLLAEYMSVLKARGALVKEMGIFEKMEYIGPDIELEEFPG